MVFVLQLLFFIFALVVRGRFLLGRHLKADNIKKERLNYIVHGKHGVMRRHVGMARQNGIPFIIRKERWYHRFLKQMGIASEIRVSDAQLDQSYYFITDFPNHLEQALHSGGLQDALKKLFALNIKSLHATRDKIWCVIPSGVAGRSDSHFNDHRDLLMEIAKFTQARPEVQLGGYVQRNLMMLAFATISIHAGILMMGLLGWMPIMGSHVDTIDDQQFIFSSLFLSVLLLGIWLFAIISMFARTSWASWVIADFVLCAVIGFMLSGAYMLRAANIHWMQAAPEIHAQQVTSRSCLLHCSKSCGKRCTRRSTHHLNADTECAASNRHATLAHYAAKDYICAARAEYQYTIHVQHWQENKGTYSFSATPMQFDTMPNGSIVNVPLHPGALGMSWLDITEIRPPS
ncbi:MAG: hypothetical protein LW823_08750 [Rickettsiales bacterium]|jgi:hypothetical protein|nr:hypothetical protein [Rickettsiales bacterium]